MKRLHVHVAVDDLSRGVKFYSTLFAAEPTVTSPAIRSRSKWNVNVFGARSRASAISPAAMPSGPAWTSNRNTSRRFSWASAARATTAPIFSIFQRLPKNGSAVNGRKSHPASTAARSRQAVHQAYSAGAPAAA